ncbi:hypothetical protein [Hyphomicrobium sp.]|jgi:hypothetical protein|uniref:hypothetical protein n=1 Tax=Hyphomicrobium sp. TaxID=82 RepID=UPI002C48C555|nr:hypothetical protein [Hyphomicrobium sp.]HVZ03779.1 hypothetical protein [Hyphomicrobium sp.]
MHRVARTILIIIIAGVIFFGQRWYRYVNNKTSPYDEVGIELNSAMPAPVRKWGCDKLHANFPKSLPPYGCQAEDGKSWM